MALLSIPDFLSAEPLPDDFFLPEVVEEVEEIKEEPIEIDEKVLCNCWKTLKTLYYPHLPSVKVITSNLQKEVGDIAVFYYSKSGLYHFAKVTNSNSENFTIDEGNMVRCQRTQRTLTYDYTHLIGFYNMIYTGTITK